MARACRCAPASARWSTVRSRKRRRWSADSSCSNATRKRKPSRSLPNVRLRSGRPWKCASSGRVSSERHLPPPMALDVSGDGDAQHVHRTIEAVWRMESAKIIGGLTRVLRDVSLAEELAHDALVAALEQWPGGGVPDNPGAWLMAAAKHRAIDVIRRNALHRSKEEELTYEIETQLQDAMPSVAALVEATFDDPLGDDVLRLMFIACHPVLSREAQAALTLRMVGGLTTDEIARAFLVPESTMAQRIVRAKRTLSEARIPFELPER